MLEERDPESERTWMRRIKVIEYKSNCIAGCEETVRGTERFPALQLRKYKGQVAADIAPGRVVKISELGTVNCWKD